MTRDDLEAVIWKHAASLDPAAMSAVLRAADDYATAQCAIAISAVTECAIPLNAQEIAAQARRRAELEQAAQAEAVA